MSAGSGHRVRELVDWDDARIDILLRDNSRLTVRGKTPVPMDVRLEPQDPDVARPEWRRIDVAGYRDESTTQVLTPFDASLELDGVWGTRGIVIQGRTKQQRFPGGD